MYENREISECKDLEFDEKIEMIDFEFDAENINLSLFGNRNSVMRMLDVEEEELRHQNSDKWFIFCIWRGNMQKVFREFEAKGLLNDFIYSLYQCSVVNFKAFSGEENAFLSSYCEQLCRNDDAQRAALYYTASNDIQKAIEVYLKNNQYRFALCLAQIRLSVTHKDILREILAKFAQFSAVNGDYETAVLCFIRLRDLTNASRVLMRRTVANEEQKQLIDTLLNRFSAYDSTIFINRSEETNES